VGPRRAVLAVLGIMAAVQPGCSDPVAPVREDLSVARARWEAKGPVSYRYDYRDVCFCAVRHLRITVRNGEVGDVEWLGETPPFVQGPQGFTIDELFDRLATGLAEDPPHADILFHPMVGYPVQAYVNPDEHTVDDEWGFAVENFLTLVP
jgi:Family of unknown function (DUF6174)